MRGTIGIIKSGSKEVVGEVDITGCFEIPRDQFNLYYDQHLVPDVDHIPQKRIWAWQLSRPVRYAVPVRYKHPRGAIIWVKLVADPLSTSIRGVM